MMDIVKITNYEQEEMVRCAIFAAFHFLPGYRRWLHTIPALPTPGSRVGDPQTQSIFPGEKNGDIIEVTKSSVYVLLQALLSLCHSFAAGN